MTNKYQLELKNCKVNCGNVTIKESVEMTAMVMNSKELRSLISEEKIPVFTMYKGQETQIGYITRIRSKMTTDTSEKYPMVLFYVDIQISTDNDMIYYDICDIDPNNKQAYRLSIMGNIHEGNRFKTGFLFLASHYKNFNDANRASRAKNNTY